MDNPVTIQGHVGVQGSLLREKGMVRRLENKVAIITGGAGGIGAATGLLFCQEGGRVVLVDTDSGAMRVAVSHIQDAVPGARVVRLFYSPSHYGSARMGQYDVTKAGSLLTKHHTSRVQF